MTSANSSTVPSPMPTSGCIGYVGGGMYLGNRTARNIALLKALKITHVVAIAYPSPSDFQYEDQDTFEADVEKEKIQIFTVTSKDNDKGDMLVEYRKVEAFLRDGTSGDNKTLVQCYFGQKRSCTLVALHLIGNEGLTALESLMLILPVRLATAPESNFIQNMKDLELERSENPKKHDSLIGVDLPKYDVALIGDVRNGNREFVKAHIEHAREVRKKQPKPEETKLEVYKQCCFRDNVPIPDDA